MFPAVPRKFLGALYMLDGESGHQTNVHAFWWTAALAISVMDCSSFWGPRTALTHC